MHTYTYEVTLHLPCSECGNMSPEIFQELLENMLSCIPSAEVEVKEIRQTDCHESSAKSAAGKTCLESASSALAKKDSSGESPEMAQCLSDLVRCIYRLNGSDDLPGWISGYVVNAQSILDKAGIG